MHIKGIRIVNYLVVCITFFAVDHVSGNEAQSNQFINETIAVQAILNENTRVIYIGEKHDRLESVDFIISHIRTLKTNGLTHIALEMITSDAQKLFNNYYDHGDEISDQDIRKYFSDNWGYKVDAYTKLVSVAKNNGIKVIGIDHPDRKASKKASLLERDQHMAQQISKTLGLQLQNRILVLSGTNHARLKNICSNRNGQSQPEILFDKFGVTSTLIKIDTPYIGPRPPIGSTPCRKSEYYFVESIRDDLPRGGGTVVKTKAVELSWDYIFIYY